MTDAEKLNRIRALWKRYCELFDSCAPGPHLRAARKALDAELGGS